MLGRFTHPTHETRTGVYRIDFFGRTVVGSRQNRFGLLLVGEVRRQFQTWMGIRVCESDGLSRHKSDGTCTDGTLARGQATTVEHLIPLRARSTGRRGTAGAELNNVGFRLLTRTSDSYRVIV